MTQMGEPLEENELTYMLELAQDADSTNPNAVNIERLAEIMIPSDDIMHDLTHKANDEIKKAELEAKARRDREESA